MDKTAKVMEVCKDVGCINRNVTKLLIDNGLDPELAKMYTGLTANLSKCDTSPCVDALAREMGYVSKPNADEVLSATPKLYDCDPKDGGICTEGLAPMGKALKFSDNAIETTTVLAEKYNAMTPDQRSRLSEAMMCLADTEISQKKREECLSNALDVLATIDPILANKYSAGRDLYASASESYQQASELERCGTNFTILSIGYGISLCVSIFVIVMYYVNRDPRGIMFLGSAFLIAQVISLIDVTKIGAQLVYPKSIDRILVTASLAVFVASQIISSVSRPGPFLRIIMILIYSVSICLITIAYISILTRGEDGSKSRCVTLSVFLDIFKDDDSRTKVTTLLQ
jgi:hypothetical protein